mgnify:CR=1 FL=1
MRPPLSTNSRIPYIAGSRAVAASVKSRAWFVMTTDVSQDHESVHMSLDRGPKGALKVLGTLHFDALRAAGRGLGPVPRSLSTPGHTLG